MIIILINGAHFKYKEFDECFDCPPGCRRCNEEKLCESCFDNFFLDENKYCRACEDLIPNCLICRNRKMCKLCQNDFYPMYEPNRTDSPCTPCKDIGEYIEKGTVAEEIALGTNFLKKKMFKKVFFFFISI